MIARLVTSLMRIFWRFSRGMTMGVRIWIEDEAGRLCLVRHTYIEGLHLPGGGVERGETALEAVKKEAREEVGVAITGVPELIGVFKHRTFTTDHVLVYRVRADQWMACESDNLGEIAEIVWHNLDDLPGDVSPATAQRIAELHGGANLDVYW
ncbi:NUDIX domain-containing protein [Woodsholea maritima]|uniref:NUDIX domain-containing protein n=1 Tax=Woodsholea maritima TaxID=240237 RepID=UPI000375D4B9|nr:NUDIX domain-containing protein [Woodsholea maritima]